MTTFFIVSILLIGSIFWLMFQGAKRFEKWKAKQIADEINKKDKKI